MYWEATISEMATGDDYIIYNSMALMSAMRGATPLDLNNFSLFRIVGHDPEKGLYHACRVTNETFSKGVERRVPIGSLREITSILQHRGLVKPGSRYYININATGREAVAERLETIYQSLFTEPSPMVESVEPKSSLHHKYGRHWRRFAEPQQEYAYFLD